MLTVHAVDVSGTNSVQCRFVHFVIQSKIFCFPDASVLKIASTFRHLTNRVGLNVSRVVGRNPERHHASFCCSISMTKRTHSCATHSEFQWSDQIYF